MATICALAAACSRPGPAAHEIRVGFVPITGIGQLFVVDGAGWAREAGLELKLTQFDSGPAMMTALASGTIDACYVGIGAIMVAAASGIDVKVVIATAVDELALVGRGDFATTADAGTAAGFKAFVAKAGHPVRISTQPPGSTPDAVLRYWLKSKEVDPATYEIIGMGIEHTQQALLAGAVDAATVREPTLTIILERDPGSKLLVPGGQMLENQPGSVLALTGAFLKRDRAMAERFVALNVRATDLLRTDPKAAAPYLHKQLGKGITNVATYEKALASPASKFIADPMQIRKATQIMQDFQISLGVLKTPPNLDDVFDDSLFRAAQKH